MTTPDPNEPPPAEPPAIPPSPAAAPPPAPDPATPAAGSASPPPDGPPPAPDAAAAAAGAAGPASPPPGESRRERRLGDSGPSSAGVVFGIILVVGGALLLVGRLTDISLGPSAWPLWLIVPGVAMVIGSFAIPPRGGLGLAIPGAILTMLGSVLWVQAATGLYSTWAYAWALIVPTGPGLGMLLYGLVRRDGELARNGLRTTLVGLALFIGLGLIFEGLLSLSGFELANVREVLPYAAIGLGVVLVVGSFAGRREKTAGT